MIPRNLLPDTSDTYDRYLIAGGWAVCPALADDRDLFILAGPSADLQEIRQEVLDHLKAEGFEFTEEQETREFIGYDGLVGIGKVAKVQFENGQDIHVLVASTKIPQEVLNSFDLSICMVGITQDGTLVKSEYWTPPTELPTVMKDTPTTSVRCNKYVERFNLRRGE